MAHSGRGLSHHNDAHTARFALLLERSGQVLGTDDRELSRSVLVFSPPVGQLAHDLDRLAPTAHLRFGSTEAVRGGARAVLPRQRVTDLEFTGRGDHDVLLHGHRSVQHLRLNTVTMPLRTDAHGLTSGGLDTAGQGSGGISRRSTHPRTDRPIVQVGTVPDVHRRDVGAGRDDVNPLDSGHVTLHFSLRTHRVCVRLAPWEGRDCKREPGWFGPALSRRESVTPTHTHSVRKPDCVFAALSAPFALPWSSRTSDPPGSALCIPLCGSPNALPVHLCRCGGNSIDIKLCMLVANSRAFSSGLGSGRSPPRNPPHNRS